MTEVRYEPRKLVIIHEYTKYDSAEDFVNESVRGAPTGSVITALKWVNGVLLTHSAMAHSETTAKELIEGRLHWDHVSFASMPRYQHQIVTPNGVTVIIRDVGGNPVFGAIAEFIKKEFLKE